MTNGASPTPPASGDGGSPADGGPDACSCTVTISPKPISLCGTGKTASLTAAGSPGGGSYSWSTSNGGVATVSGAGDSATVEPKNPGTADIKVTYTVSGCSPCSDTVSVTVAPPDVFVTEITFQGGMDIYYARIPSPAGSFMLPAPGDAAPPHKHFSPVEIRPSAGTPHWKKKAGLTADAEFSWPAAYLRTGVGPATRQLKAAFEIPAPACSSAAVKIKATSDKGVTIAEKTLTFAGGKASDTFDVQNLPATVKRLDGIQFTWTFEIDSRASAPRVTKHTIFVVDQPPKAANHHLAGGGGYENKFLWEIFEWSCKWADGVTGHQNVLNSIWAQFSPVKGSHDTGLVYWKNYGPPLNIPPNQDLMSAIQSKDDPDPNKQNAASCIVFDEVLMNCLAVQGIASAEVTLRPPSGQFTRGAAKYTCSGWKDTTTSGQANPAAPPHWASHWIADVSVPAAPNWKLYDASYGTGPTACVAPGAAISSIDIHTYEPLTAASFDCERVSPLPVANVSLPLDSSAAVPPHLVGWVLWTNK